MGIKSMAALVLLVPILLTPSLAQIPIAPQPPTTFSDTDLFQVFGTQYNLCLSQQHMRETSSDPSWLLPASFHSLKGYEIMDGSESGAS